MKQLLCPHCGAPLVKGDGFYHCPYCESDFEDDYAERAARDMAKVMEEAKMEALANRRKVLFDAAHDKYISSKKVLKAAMSVKELYAEDEMAGFYLSALNDDPGVLNAFLLGREPDEASSKEMLRFSLLSLDSRNALPLIRFAETNFSKKDASKWVMKIQEELGKVEEGVYLTSLPRKVFLAYSSADMDAVTTMADFLESNGFTTFVAARNLRIGKGAVENYQNALHDALAHCESVVFLSSESSRSIDCDALSEELPYVRDYLPDKKLIEYIVEPYGDKTKKAAKIQLKSVFRNLQWCQTEDDLLARLLAKPKKEEAICPACGKANPIHAKHCLYCGCTMDKAEYERKKKEQEESSRLAEEKRRLAEEKAKFERERQLEEERRKLREESEAKEKKLREESEAEQRRLQEERERLLRERERIRRESNAPQPGQGAQPTQAVGTGGFQIAITQISSGKETAVLKTIQTLTMVPLFTAQKMVGKLPSVVAKGLTRKEVELAKSELTAAGAVVEVFDIADDPIAVIAERVRKAKEDERKKVEAEAEANAALFRQRSAGLRDGSSFYYGTYPQAVEKNEIILEALRSTSVDEHGTYDYHGLKYMKEGTEFVLFQPIRWTIKETEPRGTALLFGSIVLDAHRFDPRSNNFANSELRSWLNKVFLKEAFPDGGKLLVPGPYKSDLITVPSRDEIGPFGYVADRERTGTDYAKLKYAKLKGAENYSGSFSYWTRSPISNDYRKAIYMFGGWPAEKGANIADSSKGVLPFIRVIDPEAKRKAAEKAAKLQAAKDAKKKAEAEKVEFAKTAHVVGDGVVAFGLYKIKGFETESLHWLILRREEDKVFLLAEKCLFIAMYQSAAAKGESVFDYLNRDFINEAFPEPEPLVGGYDGYRVFLPKAEDIEERFPEFSERVCEATPSSYGKGKPPKNAAYWLFGGRKIDAKGHNVFSNSNDRHYVRPAIAVKINPEIEAELQRLESVAIEKRKLEEELKKQEAEEKKRLSEERKKREAEEKLKAEEKKRLSEERKKREAEEKLKAEETYAFERSQPTPAECFKIKDGILLRYKGKHLCVNIPETVSEIGDKVFANNPSLREVNIPSSVVKIGDAAFSNCTSLVQANLHEGLKVIGDEAFSKTKIKSIALPDGLRTIGQHAFSYCDQVTELSIPKTVKRIGRQAFGHCSSLVSVKMLDCPVDIAFGAFEECSSLTSLDLGNAITKIGENAFRFTSLESIIIPASVTAIEESAFQGCTHLSKIDIVDNGNQGLTKIGNYAFNRCMALEEFTVPPTVRFIGDYAFAGCTGIKNFRLPKTVIEVGGEVFLDCTCNLVVEAKGLFGYPKGYRGGFLWGFKGKLSKK